MQIPKWFFMVIAASAVVMSVSAAASAIAIVSRTAPDSPDHWELIKPGRWDGGVFNATTGDECEIMPDSTTVRIKVGCVSLIKNNP